MNAPKQVCESFWRRIPALGMLALAEFVICAVTGILLVPAYKPDTAPDSLALLLLKNPAGVFVRSLHYWSAQAFLVLTLAHVLEHMLRRSKTKVTFGVWWRLSLTVPIVLAAMLSGFLLRGDGAATQALQAFISQIHQERELTILLVTHDLHIVRRHAQQVIWLHEGKVRTGTAAELLRPEHLAEVLDIEIG